MKKTSYAIFYTEWGEKEARYLTTMSMNEKKKKKEQGVFRVGCHAHCHTTINGIRADLNGDKTNNKSSLDAKLTKVLHDRAS